MSLSEALYPVNTLDFPYHAMRNLDNLQICAVTIGRRAQLLDNAHQFLIVSWNAHPTPIQTRLVRSRSARPITAGGPPFTHAGDQPQRSRIPEIMAEQPSIQRDAPGTEIPAVQAMWINEIRNLLEIFKGNYRTSNFDRYLKKLNQVGEAVRQGDRRTMKVEMGSFFQMLAKREHGINAGAADDLSNYARRVMPAQEYGIIFPRNETKP